MAYKEEGFRGSSVYSVGRRGMFNKQQMMPELGSTKRRLFGLHCADKEESFKGFKSGRNKIRFSL